MRIEITSLPKKRSVECFVEQINDLIEDFETLYSFQLIVYDAGRQYQMKNMQQQIITLVDVAYTLGIIPEETLLNAYSKITTMLRECVETAIQKSLDNCKED